MRYSARNNPPSFRSKAEDGRSQGQFFDMLGSIAYHHTCCRFLFDGDNDFPNSSLIVHSWLVFRVLIEPMILEWCNHKLVQMEVVLFLIEGQVECLGWRFFSSRGLTLLGPARSTIWAEGSSLVSPKRAECLKEVRFEYLTARCRTQSGLCTVIEVRSTVRISNQSFR